MLVSTERALGGLPDAAAMSIVAPSSDQPFDAVVWDYDGTLVDTRAADEAAVAELIRQDPAAAAGAEVFWATEGQPILRRLELAWPERAATILELFDQPFPPAVFDGILDVLDGLESRGLRMAVVSSRRVEPLERGLADCGLRDYFGAVVGLETVRAPKPDPAGLHLALRAVGVRPARSVYVGDRDVDVEAGRRAGVTTWRATWALAGFSDAPSPVEVADPREVLARVTGIDAAAG